MKMGTIRSPWRYDDDAEPNRASWPNGNGAFASALRLSSISQIFSNGRLNIEIGRILHDSMDLERHLPFTDERSSE
jgi:plasmid stabilization system protein ParE